MHKHSPGFFYVIIHSGWSLAWIFMKERVRYSKNLKISTYSLILNKFVTVDFHKRTYLCTILTLKAPPIICIRQQFQIFVSFLKITNKVWYFMRIVCRSSWNYIPIFFSKIRKDVAKFVVCCSCDCPFKGYHLPRYLVNINTLKNNVWSLLLH